LKSKSLLFVINGLPANRPENYEAEVMLMLQDIIQIPIPEDHICYLNHIDQNSSEERKELKNQLLNFIVELSPAEHIKSHDIHLKVDDISKLKKEIEEMIKEFELNKIHFQEQIHQQQERYDALMMNNKEDRDFFQRIIERQSEETAELRTNQAKLFVQMQEAQTTKLADMQSRMEEMQSEYQRNIEQMATESADQARLTKIALKMSEDAQNELLGKIRELKAQPPPTVVTEESSVSPFFHNHSSMSLLFKTVPLNTKQLFICVIFSVLSRVL
jgi:hypothetical protein